MRGLHHFQTLIAAEDRLYVAADDTVYAFAFWKTLLRTRCQSRGSAVWKGRFANVCHPPASAGISCNKFLAKLASHYRKPNGQFAIMPDDAEAFVATLPVAKFHGVGPKTAVKMRALGIETGADLRRQTLSFLQDHFGKSGLWYYDIARGRDNRLVQPDRERKSSGSETTFPEDLTDPVQIEAGVIAMTDDVWAWCEGKFSRSDRDSEDQMGGLSVVHS
jgi:nucleotidyltransferase/DNA polymerase involved in DNA repair